MAHRVQLRARADVHYAYFGRSVLVTNLDGQVSGKGAEGYYAENTRMLSRFVLCAGGADLSPIAVSPTGGDRLLAYYEVRAAEGVPEKSVYVTVDYRVSDVLDIVLAVENFSLDSSSCTFDLALEVDADFADSQEAETGKRLQAGAVDASGDGSTLRFDYRHARLRRGVTLRVAETTFEPRYKDRALIFPVRLGPRQKARVRLEVKPAFEAPGVLPDAAAVRRARAELSAQIPRLVTSNHVVARAWVTATRDLATLPLGDNAGPAAAIAGIPLYQQLFGRDTLTTAWQALAAMPSMMRDALNVNASQVGTKIDDWLDEEPGKLIHQATRGPLAAVGATNNLRNYGDYATPPDFLIMLGQYLAWTDDRATVRKLLPVAREVVDWIDRYGDLDDDGLIEYRTRSPKGVKNQGWKDADDAIVDDRGRVVEPPIATIELQAYVYVGLQNAAVAFAVAGGDRGYALKLLARARRLRRLINERFWMPDEGFYAMALGPNKAQVRSISSNPAHALAAGVVPRRRAAVVARRLMQPDMFSGWGIRTLSSAHAAYNPFSYHRGSVWPVENGTAALGFARYGLWRELHELTRGLFDLTELFIEGRLPESVAGMPRDDAHPHPGIYPASCEPQSWSASMIVLLVQSLLGMLPVAPLRMLVVDPHLPRWLPDLRLEGVAVGDAKVSLEARRQHDGRTTYKWESSGGRIAVRRQPPPQSGASILKRIHDAVTNR